MSNKKTSANIEHRNQNVLLLILTLSFTATSMLAASQPILVNIVVNVILPFIILGFCKLVFFERNAGQ